MGRTLEQILEQEDPEVVSRARKRADKILLRIRLSELRERAKKTQVEMANALGIAQPTLAGMERQGHDIKLSSLKRYVEAMGGKLHIDVELQDGTHHGIPL